MAEIFPYNMLLTDSSAELSEAKSISSFQILLKIHEKAKCSKTVPLDSSG
jgi:hypothetical protein